MERYKERKRLEGFANHPQTLHEVRTPDEPPDAGCPDKSAPPLNLYNRSAAETASNKTRLPMRGILKHSGGVDPGRRPAPVPARQKSVTTDSGHASSSSIDCTSDDKDNFNPAFSPGKCPDVFPGLYDDHRLEDGYPLIPPPLPPRPHLESGSDSDCVGSEKRFGNARDSLIDHHGAYRVTFGNNGQAARPTRPKHLKRGVKSPTCAKPSVAHVTESVPSKDGKESLFYVRTARQDEEK